MCICAPTHNYQNNCLKNKIIALYGNIYPSQFKELIFMVKDRRIERVYHCSREEMQRANKGQGDP